MSGIISDNLGRASGLLKASAGGAWNLITTITASDTATVEFTSSIDSTYGMYVIQFYGAAPASTNGYMRIRMSKDGGSNWEDDAGDYDYAGEGKTAAGEEVQSVSTGQTYIICDGHDQADFGDASHSGVGEIYIANPSSTTTFTLVMTRRACVSGDDSSMVGHGSGFLNDDGAVNAIQIYFSTGNISGVFKLYGIT